MKRCCCGLLAHVDAGKTTLSEAILYCTGTTRQLGRVDHGSAFLDNFVLERQRGITIFAKQAVVQLEKDLQVTLLDTPGHVDFSAEMERTLDVLDCAVLVISGPAGVQSHTRTVWKLLRQKNIPTFLFVNKMDLPGCDKTQILTQLTRELGEGFHDFSDRNEEEISLCDEQLLEEYLETGTLAEKSLAAAISRCKVFPCWFGAALKLEGVEDFLANLATLMPCTPAQAEFSAKVFKISRDEQGTRLTHMKITGGKLCVRETLSGAGWHEKVTQIRVYSGAKYTAVDCAFPGDVVAVTGLSMTSPGLGLGKAEQGKGPLLEPVFTFRLILPEGCDVHKAVNQLRQLEEEDPQLRLCWNPSSQQLRVQLMGPVQQEILHRLILDRFGLDVQFGEGEILYRETIRSRVEGVGHYEPLRHYAEVHLLLEPGAPGSGLVLDSACPLDKLDRNWQRLILTHLAEKQHLGVLTGAPITDMKITLASGRAHEKHTEGGDFRQATYRAVRQGLMQAESVLLEPWYQFLLELPQANVGRAIVDLQRMGAEFDQPEIQGELAVISGSAAVAKIGNYAQELTAYTKGLGRIFCSIKGYAPCAEQARVVEEIAYDPEADLENTPDSVFCSHGAGFTVKWNEVPARMHLPSALESRASAPELREKASRYCAHVATDSELMAIFERTYGPIHKNKTQPAKPLRQAAASKPGKPRSVQNMAEYLLVDGYNIIFAWDELRELAEDSLEIARGSLVERLRNFQGFHRYPVIVVFDAYKVKGNPGAVERIGGLSVVYTKEAETADMYIEKASYDLQKKYKVRVATSDGMEQLIILGNGALRVPAQSFIDEVKKTEQAIREFLLEQ